MTILVGYDGSGLADAALDTAIEEARLRGLPLKIVTTVDAPTINMGISAGATIDPRTLEQTEKRVERVAKKARKRAEAEGVEATTEIIPGAASAALVDLSADAALVVVGSHSRRGLADILLGSTSRQVATYASCPVIIVRNPTKNKGVIAVAVDGSEAGARALDFAFDEASRRGSKLRAIHAWDINVIGFDVDDSNLPRGGILKEVKEAEKRLASEVLAGHSAQYPDVKVKVRVDRGNADKVLLDNSKGVDLLVVGSRGHGGFASLLLGSVSHKVMLKAKCSVAIVR